MNHVLARKLEIECEWSLQGNRKRIGEYVDILRDISRSQLGIIPVRAPGIKFPLYLRAGTSDVRNYWQIFQRREYGFEVPCSPGTILDLGAYVGFAAVFLANRFPDAEIACVEPSPGNYFMLKANTAPYRNIRLFNAAIWDRNTTLGTSGHMAGDWGAMFGENDRGKGVEGVSISEIIDRMGWQAIDFLKCDCEGAEVQIFADRDVDWRQTIGFSTVETHDRMVPGSSSTVSSFFEGDFQEEKSGEFHVYRNSRMREVPRTQRQVDVPVFDTNSGASSIELQDVSSEHWGLFFFDRHSFQLHPNPPGQPPAKLKTSIRYDGPTLLIFGAGVTHPGAFDVDFNIALQGPDEESKPIFSRTVSAGSEIEDGIELPQSATSELQTLIFSTKMSKGELNRHAWARWFNPRLSPAD